MGLGGASDGLALVGRQSPATARRTERPSFDVDDLQPGDEIIATTLSGRFTYQVTEQRRLVQRRLVQRSVGQRPSWHLGYCALGYRSRGLPDQPQASPRLGRRFDCPGAIHGRPLLFLPERQPAPATEPLSRPVFVERSTGRFDASQVAMKLAERFSRKAVRPSSASALAHAVRRANSNAASSSGSDPRVSSPSL